VSWTDDCNALVAHLKADTVWADVYEERAPDGVLELPYLLLSFEAGVERSETLDGRNEVTDSGVYIIVVSNSASAVREGTSRVRGALRGYAPSVGGWTVREEDLRAEPRVDDQVLKQVRYGQMLYFTMRSQT
jgi:hypothetical protein